MGDPEEVQGRASGTLPRSPNPLFTTCSRSQVDRRRLLCSTSCGIRFPSGIRWVYAPCPTYREWGLPSCCTAVWTHCPFPPRASGLTQIAASYRLRRVVHVTVRAVSPGFATTACSCQRDAVAAIGPSPAALGGRFRTMRQPSLCALPARSRVGDRFPPRRLLADCCPSPLREIDLRPFQAEGP